MSQDFEKLLSAVGLLPSEVKVYLAGLELGPASAQNIAAKAKISRTATYEAVEMLQKRGLMSSSTIGKKSVFSAEDPERIVSYLQSERQRFESLQEDIKRSVESLKLLAGGIRPTVRVFEGEKALDTFFAHVAESKCEEYLEITNTDDVYSILSAEEVRTAREAHPWKTLKKIRGLTSGTIRNQRPESEARQLGNKWGEFHGNIAIYNDFVTFMTFSGKLVVVIMESSTLAASMRLLFNVIWESSKKE